MGSPGAPSTQGARAGPAGIKPENIADLSCETQANRTKDIRLAFRDQGQQACREVEEVKGAVELPEAAKQAEIARSEARLETAKLRWNLATGEQRSQWLDQMDDIGQRLAPANGSEPRRAFLMLLVGILEPELPQATTTNYHDASLLIS
jgi:hypothetical protein